MALSLKPLLRVCAVGSSLLLVGAWVAYRAGAWGGLVRADSTAVSPRPSPTPEPIIESLTERPALLGGSKSMPLELRDRGPVLGEPRPRPRATPTATKPPESEVILGGSKSMVIVPSREATAPKEKDTTPTPPSKE
jgi:hypothetical protein